jgi:hypothetical protein
MKRFVVLLALVVCAQARAEMQSWQFKDASLFADDGFNAFFTGPAGNLTGRFDFDTATHSITAFQLDAGGAIFSSNIPEIPDCPLVHCTGSASFVNPTRLVFDQQFTPAVNQRLELVLSRPLNSGQPSVSIDPSSVIYYNYGLATVHVISGDLFRSAAPLFNAPEPAAWMQLMCALGAAGLFWRVRRKQPVLATPH